MVMMTRTDGSDNSNNDRYTFANESRADILVSIHTNSTSSPTMDGSLALYFHNDDKVLAQAIYDVMYPYLRDISPHPEPKADHFTESGLDRFASGVLLRRDMPAAMMEPLFMSNPLEAELLVQPIYDDPPTASISQGCVDFAWRRGQIAHAIHSGILTYFTPVGTIHVAAIETGYVKKGPQLHRLHQGEHRRRERRCCFGCQGFP